jgi:Arc/MetJ-type ribon-helix-helix transcriptional regulator
MFLRTLIPNGHMDISSKPTRAVARRRRGATHNLRKATFQVDEGVLQAVRSLVEQGETPSANAFVEEALRLKLREVRQARLYAAYGEAAEDPEFLADMEATMRAFDTTVGDGLADEAR